MALRPVSVTQLNEYISRVLSTDPLLGNISVIGEISNLKYHSSGHVYFSMIDEGSKVNCFLPASYAKSLAYQLGDGLEIVVKGYINVYKKGGAYTLFVRSIEVSGDGSLAAAFQLMKDKLEQEGLFDPAYKKPIPLFPHKLGIVTSDTGAAVQDMLKIIKSRTNLVDIFVFPVQVQGQGAAEDIAAMVDRINAEYPDMDTLIVGRGGGSMEDLWAFNEEIVARAIFRSRIPVVSAVGHEVDFTISDFVADKRAETPTAAAEMTVPDSAELERQLDILLEQLTSRLNSKVEYQKLKAESCLKDIKRTLDSRLAEQRHALEKFLLILEENKPEKILEKGYAMVEDMEGNVISSIETFHEGGRYQIRLQDGRVFFTINTLKKEGDSL
ncbi:MAG: exodeoxyribonuclease VII large subunit [Firmicutes bacterium]|nr:exodeoxyribonuclease VII large subunit [Bacillota bacterium]